MFIRRKHNRSGTISVVVVDKSGGSFKEVHRLGVARNEAEAEALESEGRHWIATYGGQKVIDFENKAAVELRAAEDILSRITSARLTAAQTIINKVYDIIGFNAIRDEELRHLVIGRICQPMSKKTTVDYLRRHFKDDVSLQKIYRYMDKLSSTQKEIVQEISVRHTRDIFGGDIGILFYDVTTLYFETTAKDSLRDNGFSKDGKNANPQVVLGLLVSRGGYPLSYSLFNTVCIDESKIEEDKVWDGLKGYRTNTNLPAAQVNENYQQLWNVERAFRITKGTLEVRPMFHFSERRIEAHVCICFVASKVYKELERLLKASGCPYSIDNVIRIADVIVTLEIDLPDNGKTLTRTIYTSQEERDIAYLIETDGWLIPNG